MKCLACRNFRLYWCLCRPSRSQRGFSVFSHKDECSMYSCIYYLNNYFKNGLITLAYLSVSCKLIFDILKSRMFFWCLFVKLMWFWYWSTSICATFKMSVCHQMNLVIWGENKHLPSGKCCNLRERNSLWGQTAFWAWNIWLISCLRRSAQPCLEGADCILFSLTTSNLSRLWNWGILLSCTTMVISYFLF